MKIEEVIGENVLEVREDLGLSQAQLGEALASYLGKSWSRQAVSAAEKGRRAFTASELLALAEILKTTVYRLMTPPVSVANIEMPAEGVVVKANTVTRLALPTGATETAFEEAGSELEKVGKALDEVVQLVILGRKALGRSQSHMADAASSLAVRIAEEHGRTS